MNTDDSREVIFVCFKHNGKKGCFKYRLFGYDDDIGIDDYDYEEKDNEDIYAIIHNWVSEHIETRRSIKLDGKEIRA